MKMFLISLIMLTAPSLYAQDSRYANDKKSLCEKRENCLISENNVYKFIPIQDRAGNIIGEEINSRSALSDVVYDRANLCFQGKPQEICNIAQALADNEETLYYQGGHSLIDRFECKIIHHGAMVLVMEIYHDWPPHLEQRSYNLRKCY